MESNNRIKKGAIFMDYSPKEIASELAPKIKEAVLQIHKEIEEKNSNEYKKPISMTEASRYVGIGRTLFSKIVNQGLIPFHSLNPNNPKAKKLFYRDDLQNWVKSNRIKTINEIKNASKNGK